MKTSEAINELAAAMAKAQADLKPAVKDALNPYYQSKYADMAAVWEVCRKAFAPNGLAIFQDVTNDNPTSAVSVTTRIIHTSGQWIEFSPLFVPVTKQDAHGVGSACTYGRRYSLQGATGIVSEADDDGNAAVGLENAQGNGHTEHIERGACATTPPQQNPDPLAPPRAMRPTGNFGYGKKYANTPWNLMSMSQLEWFRDNADRTPEMIREKIHAEIAWRIHETAKADTYTVPVDTEFDDKIPYDGPPPQ